MKYKPYFSSASSCEGSELWKTPFTTLSSCCVLGGVANSQEHEYAHAPTQKNTNTQTHKPARPQAHPTPHICSVSSIVGSFHCSANVLPSSLFTPKNAGNLNSNDKNKELQTNIPFHIPHYPVSSLKICLILKPVKTVLLATTCLDIHRLLALIFLPKMVLIYHAFTGKVKG